jgi:hypothetical protein
MEGFWRELYNPNPVGEYVKITGEDVLNAAKNNNLYINSFKKCDVTKINIEEPIDYNSFYVIYNASYTPPEGANNE